MKASLIEGCALRTRLLYSACGNCVTSLSGIAGIGGNVRKAIVQFSILMLFSVLLCPQIVRAQIAPTSTASIRGSVTDSAGKPVANAKVSLSGPKSASTQTDTQGL